MCPTLPFRTREEEEEFVFDLVTASKLPLPLQPLSEQMLLLDRTKLRKTDGKYRDEVHIQWIALIYLPENKELLHEFEQSLDESQYGSHQMLLAYNINRMNNDSFHEFSFIVEAELDPRIESSFESIMRTPPKPENHHQSLVLLERWEFLYSVDILAKWKLPNRGLPLRQARLDAASYRSCTAIARTFFSLRIGVPWKDVAKEMAEFSRELRYGPSLDPCPWLNRKRQLKRDDLPAFLWDTKEMKTRSTDDILRSDLSLSSGHVLEYVAVSHTWGRWADVNCLVRVAGVPWRIPSITTFEVQNLPAMLRNLGQLARFVWLDLVTIPQGCLNEREASVRSNEIARQAVIFQGASVAVAWFHDIKNWSGMISLIQYLCICYLVKTRDYKDIPRTRLKKLGRTYREDAAHPIELVTSHQDQSVELNPWFTSLWTLQEFCLRPDMLLIAKDCKTFLTLEILPMKINEITALFEKGLSRKESNDPAGLQQFRQLSPKMSFQEMDLGEIDIIIRGNNRQCTGRRVEAIVSVLGFGEWFLENPHEHENKLVLGKYPLEFVRHLKETWGPARFFTTAPGSYDVSKSPIDINIDIETPSRRIEVPTLPLKGSMLPFNETTTLVSGFDIRDILMDHPATETWDILEDGSAFMPSAGILVSNTDDFQIRPIKCFLCTGATWEALHCDLASLVKSFNRDNAGMYAICTAHKKGYSKGILLVEYPPQKFKKWGIYEVTEPEFDMPESQLVNWIVN